MGLRWRSKSVSHTASPARSSYLHEYLGRYCSVPSRLHPSSRNSVTSHPEGTLLYTTPASDIPTFPYLQHSAFSLEHLTLVAFLKRGPATQRIRSHIHFRPHFLQLGSRTTPIAATGYRSLPNCDHLPKCAERCSREHRSAHLGRWSQLGRLR